MTYAALAILLLQLPVAAPETVAVRGVVRSDATGEPIGGASVVCLDARASGWSTATGEYELRGLRPGVRHFEIAARGYQPLAFDVLLAAGTPLRLDITLTREPAMLPELVVRGESRTFDGNPLRADRGWRVTGPELLESPALAQPDVFRAIALAPTSQMTTESATAVHVRGGSADQNLILLDGAPVYSPVHSGRLLSAFSADIVEELTVHDAAAPARYGGRLASVIELRTRASREGRFAAGGFDPTAFHAAAMIPVVRDAASLLVSARRSYSGVRHGDLAEIDMPGSWLDAFAKLELRLGETSIAVSAFTADNGLGFPAGRGELRNRFEWTTTTSSLAIDRPFRAGAVSLRLWRARFDAGATWAPDTSLLTLGNKLEESGGRAAVSLPFAAGEFGGGVEVQKPQVRYDVRPVAGAGSAAPFELASAPTIVSLFVEESWRAARRLTVQAGLRGSSVTGLRPQLEPRLSLRFELSQRVSLVAGYAQMHQYTQSLRNEESLLATILGPDLLVAVGAPGVPVARSAEATAGFAARLGEHGNFRLEGYDREMSGLVLIAPTTAAPFATKGFARGRGRARGAGTSLDWTLGRIDLVSSYGVSAVDRALAGRRYHVGFAPTQAATIAAGYRLGRRTKLRSALALTSERVTTTIDGAIDWDTRDPVSGAREIAGTPNSTRGSLNGDRLPAYLRLDVGARHTVPIGRGGVTAFGSVTNALSRQNVTGYAVGAGERPRALEMVPLSVVFGLEWRF